jgi:hypothetical protein
MSVRKARSALIGALVAVAMALLAPAALASTTPTIALDQSAGTQAGASLNLGMDLKFTNSSGDSPDVMTINLPPGLLANADIDGGSCLKTADLTDANCQVGTGAVTAYPLDSIIPFTLDVTFDLVPPPAPGDLAGLAVNFENGTQIGTTGDIKVRPSGDPNGVGISIVLTLPNSLIGMPMQLGEINSTFDGLRYPTACPSTPAKVGISVDSYNDSTVQQVSAPLSVTGCSSLPYAPKATVSAVKDSGDRVVAITTAVTQAANESPNKNLTLAFPDSTLGVNLAAVKLLCLNVSSGSCTPVGTATAVSPLYPTPLTANAYLTGTALGPDLTLVFPAPFPLTLTGTVALTTKTAAFTGLPDIPLTSLKLVLNGGADGMFLTNCNPGTGVADASSTDQNGDKTASSAINYSIVGCAASSSSSSSKTDTNTAPTVTSSAVTGLKSGHPSLSFKVSVPKKAAKLTQVSVKLTPGISFIKHKVGKKMKVTGVSLTGAKIKSLAIAKGRLVIKLKKASTSFRVKLTTVLHEDDALIADAAKGKKTSLHLSLIARNTRNKSHTIKKTIKL